MIGGNVTEKSHITSDEQIEVDAAMTQIQEEIERLVEKVYLMGYTKGLRHQENTPYFP